MLHIVQPGPKQVSDTMDVPAAQAAHAAARPPIEDDPTLLPGLQLGAYRIVGKLGEGGMGCVYLAEHAVIRRRVALKVLRRSLIESQRSVERFFAEAEAVNRIRHPAIVEVTDLFVADGTPCIVMELLEGRTWAAEINDGVVSPARVVAIGREIAAALAATHAAGVVHRDLKPENIFLAKRSDGTEAIKILDFGVAKLVDTGDSSARGAGKTAAGAILGTPEYMAPEQLAGKPVDARADIYTLGVTLYHAAAGHVPFHGASFGDFVVKHLTQEPPALSGPRTNVPPGLERAIFAMLVKDVDKRVANMQEVDALLASALTWQPARRLPYVALAASVAVVVAFGAALGMGAFSHPTAQATSSSSPQSTSLPVTSPVTSPTAPPVLGAPIPVGSPGTELEFAL